jgi:peroxiredoxin Q/BCP
MTPDQQTHLLNLFAVCSQPTATEAEHSELQTALRTNADARQLWFLYQDVELGLKCLSQSFQQTAKHPEAQISDSRSTATIEVRPGAQTYTSSEGASRASWFARRRPAMAVVALACLSVMAILGLHTWSLPPGDFTVDSPTHETAFAMSEQKGKIVVLHFLLKTECPFCLKLTNDYARIAASEPDVVHVFLKPDSANEIKAWAGKINQEGLKTPPVIYRDADAQLANRFGIPDGYEFHGQMMHYPALVLLDGSGNERFRYVGKDHTDRMKPEDFVTRLAMVTNHN